MFALSKLAKLLAETPVSAWSDKLTVFKLIAKNLKTKANTGTRIHETRLVSLSLSSVAVTELSARRRLAARRVGIEWSLCLWYETMPAALCMREGKECRRGKGGVKGVVVGKIDRERALYALRWLSHVSRRRRRGRE